VGVGEEIMLHAVKNHGKFYTCTIIGVLLIVLLLNFGAMKRQLHDWKLLPEPQTLTELSFTYPNKLPGAYTPSRSQRVSFTVHDDEYATIDYRYQIIEETSNSAQQQVLHAGSFVLRQGQSEYPTVNVSLVDMGKKVQLEVILSPVGESINYRMTKS
jgi:hypothetical protein